jgi:hypothetical protein
MSHPLWDKGHMNSPSTSRPGITPLTSRPFEAYGMGAAAAWIGHLPLLSLLLGLAALACLSLPSRPSSPNTQPQS